MHTDDTDSIKLQSLKLSIEFWNGVQGALAASGQPPWLPANDGNGIIGYAKIFENYLKGES